MYPTDDCLTPDRHGDTASQALRGKDERGESRAEIGR